MKRFKRCPNHIQGLVSRIIFYQLLDTMPNVYDIDYLCGAKYRGELKGQYRHGVGALLYEEHAEPLIGFWKNDIMILDSIEHPTKILEPIAITKYKGRKRSDS